MALAPKLLLGYHQSLFPSPVMSAAGGVFLLYLPECAPDALAFDAVSNLPFDHVDSLIFFLDIRVVTVSMTVSIFKFNASAISSG